MPASRTLHDVDGFKIEVAYVGIGRVFGQANSLKQVHVTEGPVRLPAFHAVLLNFGLGISNFGFPQRSRFRSSIALLNFDLKLQNCLQAAGTGWRASISNNCVVCPRAALRSPSIRARIPRQGPRSN